MHDRRNPSLINQPNLLKYITLAAVSAKKMAQAA
jgi:hypothetical protein